MKPAETQPQRYFYSRFWFIHTCLSCILSFCSCRVCLTITNMNTFPLSDSLWVFYLGSYWQSWRSWESRLSWKTLEEQERQTDWRTYHRYTASLHHPHQQFYPRAFQSWIPCWSSVTLMNRAVIRRQTLNTWGQNPKEAPNHWNHFKIIHNLHLSEGHAVTFSPVSPWGPSLPG